MIVYAEFLAQDILPLIREDGYRIPFNINGRIFMLKVNSNRLILFSKNKTCVSCGITGAIFRLEASSAKDPLPHLNLYANENGKFILMTKDHIIPRSKGGSDSMHNLQTMCHRCNERKGDSIY